jgi:hypothetical protein
MKADRSDKQFWIDNYVEFQKYREGFRDMCGIHTKQAPNLVNCSPENYFYYSQYYTKKILVI